MARWTINSRAALDRAGVAEYTGVAYSTVVHWCRHRTRFGFPDGVQHEGREVFWLDTIDAFHTAHLAAKRAQLTTVDRRGDPTELVGSSTAAKILGYRSYRNLPHALLDRADHIETLPSGWVRRRWYRRTVWAIADARTGRQSTGRTPGTTGTRKPHWYTNDPRLNLARQLLHNPEHQNASRRSLAAILAEQLGVSTSTAQRLLTVAADPTPT